MQRDICTEIWHQGWIGLTQNHRLGIIEICLGKLGQCSADISKGLRSLTSQDLKEILQLITLPKGPWRGHIGLTCQDAMDRKSNASFKYLLQIGYHNAVCSAQSGCSHRQLALPTTGPEAVQMNLLTLFYDSPGNDQAAAYSKFQLINLILRINFHQSLTTLFVGPTTHDLFFKSVSLLSVMAHICYPSTLRGCSRITI